MYPRMRKHSCTPYKENKYILHMHSFQKHPLTLPLDPGNTTSEVQSVCIVKMKHSLVWLERKTKGLQKYDRHVFLLFRSVVYLMLEYADTDILITVLIKTGT